MRLLSNESFIDTRALRVKGVGFFIYSLKTRGSGLAFKAFNIAQHDLWTSYLGVISIPLNYGWRHYLSHDLSRLFLAQNSILQNGTTFNYHHSDDTDAYIISVFNLILPNLCMYSFIRNFITFHTLFYSGFAAISLNH